MASSSKRDNFNMHDNNFDVVIVGAGLTGLTAAYSILKKHVGLSILILEKNDTIGGRILPENNSQAYFGSFSQDNISTMINELGLRTETGCGINGKNLIFLTKGGPLEKISWLDSCQVFYFLKLLQAISVQARYKNYHDDEENDELSKISINRLIERMVYLPRGRKLCKSLLNTCCPGIEDLRKVSALWFMVMLHGAGGLFKKLSATLGDEKRFFIKDGFLQLVKILERRIIDEGGIIKCGENVVKIEKNQTRLRITTETKKFICDYVIIAVPPPFNGEILLESSFPDFFLDSLNSYETGKNNFFIATYSEAFWPENWSGGRIIGTENCGSNLRDIYDATHSNVDREKNINGVLAGFFSNSPSDDLNPLNDVCQALNRCFRTANGENCNTSGLINWTSANPLNVLKPSSMKFHVNPLLLSLEKIFFAVSEYATSWPGTADGAIEAGRRVACKILLRARPQSLDINQIIKYTLKPFKILKEKSSPTNLFKESPELMGFSWDSTFVSYFFYFVISTKTPDRFIDKVHGCFLRPHETSRGNFEVTLKEKLGPMNLFKESPELMGYSWDLTFVSYFSYFVAFTKTPDRFINDERKSDKLSQ